MSHHLSHAGVDFILQKARFHHEVILSALADFTLIIRGITFACLRAHITVCISKQYHCRKAISLATEVASSLGECPHQRRPPRGSWLRRRLRENTLKGIFKKQIIFFSFHRKRSPVDCQASATPKNASKGENQPKHFFGLKLIDKTIFCKISLSKE